MELTDTELGRKVAERMGYVQDRRGGTHGYSGNIWYDGESNSLGSVRDWQPCHRPDHWWLVVEWVRRQQFSRRMEFIREIRTKNLVEVSYATGLKVESVDPWHWWLFFSTPGRAICEAFSAVFCVEED